MCQSKLGDKNSQRINFYCVKKNQLNAQLVLSVFRQPLHVSGVSRPIIRRYNRMYKTIGICPGWIGIQPGQIPTVVHVYAQNM